MSSQPHAEHPPPAGLDRASPCPDDIRRQLERIIDSQVFRGSARSCACLRIIVEESLAQRPFPLKEREIAAAMLGQDQPFDPVTNPSVRVQVSRLRARLVRYYSDSGIADPIEISVPPGHYIATFAERQGPSELPPERTPVTAIRVAVLRLADVHVEVPTGGGLSERIVADLSRYPGLEVIGPLSRGADDEPDPQLLADRLDAHLVLDGSVRQDAARLRVVVRLVNGITGAVIWSQSYEDTASGTAYFEAKANIAARVAAALADYQGVAMRVPLPPSTRPGNPVVFEALRQFYAWGDMLDFDRYDEVIGLLEEALEIEPRNTTVMTVLAGAHHLGPQGHNDDPTGRGIELARRAHEIDPTLAVPVLVFAVRELHLGNLDAAAMWAHRAAQLSPNHPTVLYTAGLNLVSALQWEEGLELIEQAMDLTPNHPDYWFAVHAMDALRRCEWERALALGQRVGDTAPPWGPLIRAAADHGLGRAEELERELVVLCESLLGFETDPWASVAGVQHMQRAWVPLFVGPLEHRAPDVAEDLPTG